MLTRKILGTTAALAMTASIALLAGCPAPTTTPVESPSATVEPVVSPTAAPVVSPTAAPVVSPTAPVVTPTTDPAATATPVAATGSSNPVGQTGSTTDIKERATFNGKVYDVNGVPVDGASVTAKSVDTGVTWVGEAQVTTGGAYVFRNAPVGSRLEITASKDGWTTRVRNEVLKSNLQGDPAANVFDFGGGANPNASPGYYAIQDEPEITELRVNGKLASAPGNLAGTPVVGAPDAANTVNLSGLDFDKMVVKVTFDEPVDKATVESNFKIYSQDDAGFTPDGITPAFVVDQGFGTFVWDDAKNVTFTTTKPLLTRNTGTEIKYRVVFSERFKDLAGNESVVGGAIRYSPGISNDYLNFSLKNDDSPFVLKSVTALDNPSGDFDKLVLEFNKNLDVYVKRSIDGTKNLVDGLGMAQSTDGNSIDVFFTKADSAVGANDLDLAKITKYSNGVVANLIDDGFFESYSVSGSKLTLEAQRDDWFANGDRIAVKILGDFSSPAGKTISTDNSVNTSVGGNNVISTNDSIKVGAAQ